MKLIVERLKVIAEMKRVKGLEAGLEVQPGVGSRRAGGCVLATVAFLSIHSPRGKRNYAANCPPESLVLF